MMHQVDRYFYGSPLMAAEPRIIDSPWPTITVPDVSLPQLLLQMLDKHADQTLVDSLSGQSYSFYQLSEDSRRLATGWRQLGLKPGDCFGIIGPNSYKYLAILFGGLIVGGVASGIRSTDTFREVSDKIIQRNLKFLAVDVAKHQNIASAVAQGIPITQKILIFNGDCPANSKYECYDHLLTLSPCSSSDTFSPSDLRKQPCMLMSTSGTSSLPKPVVFSHYSIVSALAIASLPAIFNYTTSDIVSAHSQFAHQSAIFQSMVSVVVGCRFVLQPKFSYEQFIQNVAKYGITAALLPTSALIQLVTDSQSRCEQLATLQKVICCGSVLPKHIGHQFIEKFTGVKDFRQGLFQTECVGPVTMTLKGSADVDSVGVPVPNTRVIVIDPESGEQLGPNSHGEVCVLRDAPSMGYWQQPDANRRLVDYSGWLHTGDLGYYDNDGFLYIVDNIAETIHCGQVVVLPSELETLLLTHEAVRQAVVVGIPMNSIASSGVRSQHIPVGFVIVKDDFVGKITGHDIEDYVNGIDRQCEEERFFKNSMMVREAANFALVYLDQLPKRRRVAEVHLVNEFPITTLGKVIKRQLRDDLLYSRVQRKF